MPTANEAILRPLLQLSRAGPSQLSVSGRNGGFLATRRLYSKWKLVTWQPRYFP